MNICIIINIFAFVVVVEVVVVSSSSSAIIIWPTEVKGDPKAPFSIATTARCSGGRFSFPSNAPLTLDSYFIMLSVKPGASSTVFEFFI